MLPAISSATRSTPSSMRNETPTTPTVAPTRSSRGNYTFFTRLALPTARPCPPVSAVGEEGPRQQAAQQEEGEHVRARSGRRGRRRPSGRTRRRACRSPSGASGLSSDQRPAEDRALVLAAQLAQREVGEQLSVAAASRRQWSSSGAGSGGPWQDGIRYRLMRITFVSAHYPPNFVSGGTLQPQRLARGLRDRGHDVSRVRRLARQRRAARWRRGTRSTSTGLPVRWIVTTPWMAWADERNYDNPAVAARVRRPPRASTPPTSCTCTRSRPSASAWWRSAAASGAATVVTMHDFWWVCARQFLVDRDRPALLPRGRGRRLRRARSGDRTSLRASRAACARPCASADLVLAPSRSAADGARAPTGSTRPSSRSTRTGWTCRRPVAARAGAPPAGEPVGRPLHRRAATR